MGHRPIRAPPAALRSPAPPTSAKARRSGCRGWCNPAAGQGAGGQESAAVMDREALLSGRIRSGPDQPKVGAAVVLRGARAAGWRKLQTPSAKAGQRRPAGGARRGVRYAGGRECRCRGMCGSGIPCAAVALGNLPSRCHGLPHIPLAAGSLVLQWFSGICHGYQGYKEKKEKKGDGEGGAGEQGGGEQGAMGAFMCGTRGSASDPFRRNRFGCQGYVWQMGGTPGRAMASGSAQIPSSAADWDALGMCGRPLAPVAAPPRHGLG